MMRPLVLGLNGRLLRYLWKVPSSSIEDIDSVSSIRGSGVHTKLPHTILLSWVVEVGREEGGIATLVASLLFRSTAFDTDNTRSNS
jgi:hypothetical protein